MAHQTSSKTYHFADAILEHMPVAVAVYDAQELRLLEANTLFLTIMEQFLDPSWHQGRIIGSLLTDWAHPAVIPRLVEIFQAVAETGLTYQIGEFAFPTSDGTPTYWNWSVERMPVPDEHAIHLLQTITDVTTHVLARQQAEQARTSLGQRQQAVEAECKRLDVTEMVARTVREALDLEIVGKTTIEALSQNLTPRTLYIHIADAEKQALQLLNFYTSFDVKLTLSVVQDVSYRSPLLLAGAHKQRDPIIVEDLQIAAATGVVPASNPLVPLGVHGYICVPLWFKDHFEGALTASFQQAIQKNGTEVQTLISCGIHIAVALAHARLHATLEYERARLRTALDQLPEGVLMIASANGVVSYANCAARDILGLSLPNIVGFPLHDCPQPHETIDPNNQSATLKFTLIRALCGETISGQETMVFMPDGSTMVLLLSAAPLSVENGVVTGAVLVFQDITAQKSIERLKNEFLSIASHELRTPITTIQGLAEILQLQVSQGISLDSPRSIRAISSIVEQSQHLTRLIEEMLDLSRLETAQLSLNLASHDLLSTIKQVIEMQSITTNQHQLSLVLEGLEPTTPLLAAFDENRIIQVLNNLISNARKYSPVGSKIEVGLQYQAETCTARIWVRDQGIGIAPKDLPHIFERFHRASNVDRSISGLGIGLYLVNELVTRHRGHVWVESSEGVGSTFYVQLPLNQRQEECPS